MPNKILVAKALKQKWSRHVQAWSNCRGCHLCETRTKTVLYRGDLPCELLFVGEGPGESEDLLGFPFVGPAGKKLDEMVQEAMEVTREFSYGVTNLVACIPLEQEELSSGHPRAPTKQEVLACRKRLTEVVQLARPTMVLTLGAVALKHMTQIPNVLMGGLLHPSAILRNPSSSGQLLETKRFTANLVKYLRRIV